MESSVMHRLETFTTDAEIIRLISRHVSVFPTAIATQLIWKNSWVTLPVLRPFGLLGKGLLPRWQNPAYAIALTVFAVFEVI